MINIHLIYQIKYPISQIFIIFNTLGFLHLPWCFTMFHRGPKVSPSAPKAPMGLSNRSMSSGWSASTTKVSSAEKIHDWGAW